MKGGHLKVTAHPTIPHFNQAWQKALGPSPSPGIPLARGWPWNAATARRTGGDGAFVPRAVTKYHYLGGLKQ